MAEIAPETVADFERDGAVLLRGVFSDFVEGAREAIEENKASPSWRERTYRPGDGLSPFFQDYCVWNDFDDSYFLRYRSSEIAWHTAWLAPQWACWR